MPAYNHWPDIIADIERLINQSWSDITFMDEVVDYDKYDWEDLQRRGLETLPMALYDLPRFTPTTAAGYAVPWKEGQISIFYVAADDADIATLQRAKLNALEYNLQALKPFASMVPDLTNISIDWSPGNPANVQLLARKLSMLAGMVQFRCLVPGALVP